jgi:hypothetical protein
MSSDQTNILGKMEEAGEITFKLDNEMVFETALATLQLSLSPPR